MAQRRPAIASLIAALQLALLALLATGAVSYVKIQGALKRATTSESKPWLRGRGVGSRRAC